MILINDKPITAKEFAYDGCHKIYLINSKEERKTFEDYGYNFLPVEALKEVYENSCSLKFISNGSLNNSPVSQFEKATIKEVKPWKK